MILIGRLSNEIKGIRIRLGGYAQATTVRVLDRIWTDVSEAETDFYVLRRVGHGGLIWKVKRSRSPVNYGYEIGA